MNSKPIKARDRDMIFRALRAGVVPHRGQHLIQVGRADELHALNSDIESISEGGSTIRFIIGEYGSGKTFFLNLVRAIAMEKKLVASNADLNPDRRLHASNGQARSLYTELMHNLSTRSKSDGGALTSTVEKFISTVRQEANVRDVSTESVIHEKLHILSESVGGYEFAEVIAAYWRGHDQGDETLKMNAIRWLRGEFTTKTDSRNALGVRTIINDANVYDHLKILARFFRLAGYGGLLICLDEMVNLYKLSHTQARNANYEQILRILNDVLQGTVEGLGFVMGGTPEFLLDTRKGVYSYAALESRLAENRYATDGLKDYSGPVLHLANLSGEDLFVLLQNLRHVQALGDADRYLLSNDALELFLKHCHQHIGDAYFRTPRQTIREFANILAILEQNPETELAQLIGHVKLEPEQNHELEEPEADESGLDGSGGEDLATLRL